MEYISGGSIRQLIEIFGIFDERVASIFTI